MTEYDERRIAALPRQLRDLAPLEEPETTKQIGREAADEIGRLRAELAGRGDDPLRSPLKE